MTKSKKHLSLCMVLLVISTLVGWTPIVQTFALAWQNDEYTHILLILPVSVFMCLLERQHLQQAEKWDFQVGPAILAAAVSVVVGAGIWSSPLSGDEQLAIDMFALVLAWIGTFVISFGRQACNRVLFPLLFLFALVPIPRFALEDVIALLQQGTTWSTHALFALFNVPTLQQGFELMIPGLTIEIAQECSSIRSSSMLVITTLVLAQVFLRSSWRRAVVVVLAIPLSVVKNGVRVFTIAMLGTRVDPGYLDGRLHHQGGILFFLVALLIEIAIILILKRREETLSESALRTLLDSGAAG